MVGHIKKTALVDSVTLSATISGCVAVSVAAITAGLTYLLTKRREREADWRKMKLELYREYMAALSGIVEGRETPEGHTRYADAVNSLTLVASPSVLKPLYAYLDYNSCRTIDKNLDRHDRLLTGLVRAMREDMYPADREGNNNLSLRLITVPPHSRSSHEAVQQD